MIDKSNVIHMIDHTILKSTASKDDIIIGCEQLLRYSFASICIHPCNVKLCNDYLQGRGRITTVIGFPFGANTTSVKAYEAQQAVKNGANELDMVINIGALKEGNLSFCRDDIRAVVEASEGNIVKVIIETSLLTDDEKRRACDVIREAGAHFVKTSTGYQGAGATVEDIKLLRMQSGNDLKVKASGGIRTMVQCIDMINAGADRIGTGSAVQIAEDTTVTDNLAY